MAGREQVSMENPGLFMRKKKRCYTVKGKNDFQKKFGRMKVKISHQNDYLKVEIEKEVLDTDICSHAYVFLTNESENNNTTLYFQRDKKNCILSKIPEKFLFKIGEKEAKLLKLVVSLGNCGIRMNLNYVNFDESSHWFDIEPLDFDGFPKEVSITLLGIFYKRFESKNLNKQKPSLSVEDKMQIQRMFCKMDPSGNGYVDLPEFEAYLRKYQMSLGRERSGYLFSVIHSMNAELKEGGSVPHGITLHDLLFYFEHEHVPDTDDEDDDGHVGLLSVPGDQDEVDTARRLEDDRVFQATMFQLLRRQSVGEINLQEVADQRWSAFDNFERKVEDETIMKGRKGIVGDILPGNYTLEELSLVSEEKGSSIRKVPNSQSLHKMLSINDKSKSELSQTLVKYTSIKGIKLQENPGQIIFPDHFDGRIQIDVGKIIFDNIRTL